MPRRASRRPRRPARSSSATTSSAALGVADLLLGYDLVAERRKLRGVSTEMLLHRVARGLARPRRPRASRRRRPPAEPPPRGDVQGALGGVQDRPPRGVRRSAPLRFAARRSLAPQRRPSGSGGARGRRAPLQAAAGQALEAVVGGVLVDLGAGRDVEGRVDEAIDGLAARGCTAWPTWMSSAASSPTMWTPRRRRSSRRKTSFRKPYVVPAMRLRGLPENAKRPVATAMPAAVAASSVRPTMATSGME